MSVESQKIRRGESRSGWTDLNPGHVKGVLNVYFAQEKKNFGLTLLCFDLGWFQSNNIFFLVRYFLS